MSNERADGETYAALIQQIERAFADVQYPGDDNIIGTPAHVAECEECSGLHRALAGRKWTEVVADDESSKHVSHAMSFFSPAGWQYYLPAYLIQAVRSRTFDSLYFRSSDDPVVAEYMETRINRLTGEQCQAVIAYLLAVRKEEHFNSWAHEGNLQAINHWQDKYRKVVIRNRSGK